MTGWDRARRAYERLLAEVDPAAAWLAAGATDLRMRGGRPDEVDGPVVVAGPDDLREIQAIVDTQLGVGCWPRPPTVAGERRSTTVAAARGAVTALVHALEGHIELRSPWARWRTAVDTMASRLDLLEVVTLEAVLVPGRTTWSGTTG